MARVGLNCPDSTHTDARTPVHKHSRHLPSANSTEDAPDPERRSGRVQFDQRGQAVWEWAVQTGKFDINASTSRIKALTSGTLELESTPTASSDAATAPETGNPYERALPKPGESLGGNPYGRGAKTPLGQRAPAAAPRSADARNTGNPYDRPIPKPGESPGGDPYGRGAMNPHGPRGSSTLRTTGRKA
jgi:hypothetical protein